MAQAGVKKPAVDIIKVDGCKDYTSIKYLDELNKRQRVSGWCDAASAAFAIGYNCSWCDCFSMHMPISCSHAKSIASSNDALNPPVILVENPWWRRCCTFSEPLFTLLLLCDWQSHPNYKITLQRPTYRNIFLMKSWKTKAVSTTDWMVETQLCKLRGTSDTLVGVLILYFVYNMVFLN